MLTENTIVRHKRDAHLGQGIITAVSRRIGAYSPWLYTVAFSNRAATLVKYSLTDADIDPVAPMTPPVDALPPSGAVRDAVVGAVVERLGERRPGRPSHVAGLNVVDGGRAG